jgi:hypothetical protein
MAYESKELVARRQGCYLVKQLGIYGNIVISEMSGRVKVPTFNGHIALFFDFA